MPKVRSFALTVPAVAAVCAVLVLSGCSPETAKAETSTPSTTKAAEAQAPKEPVVVLAATDPAELALAASRTFFTSAPVVVLARADDASVQGTAAAVATTFTAPVLLVGGGVPDSTVSAEITRLGAKAVVEVTDDAAMAAASPSADPTTDVNSYPELEAVTVVDIDTDALLPSGELDPRDVDDLRESLPQMASPETLTEVLALTEGTPGQVAAVATAKAAGAVPLVVPGGDPRAKAEIVEAVSSAKALSVVAIGASFGSVEDLTWKVRTAESGKELPGGGQLVFGGHRYAVVPGSVTTGSLGPVSQEDISRLLVRAEGAAEELSGKLPGTVLPAVEVPVTLASRSAGADGNYSIEVPAEQVRPLLDAAAIAGVYVVLRFESGRTPFPEQIAQYAELLKLPGVGVALEVDARRADGMRYATVSGTEVNGAITHLAALTRAGALPQKMVVVRQTSPTAVVDWSEVRPGAGEVAVVTEPTQRTSVAARASAYGDFADRLPAGIHRGWTVVGTDPVTDLDALKALTPVPEYIVADH